MTVPPELRIVKVEWSIKGYHVFRTKPHYDIDLKVEIEHNNPVDDNAMKVMMPVLHEIPRYLHDAETCPGHQRSKTIRRIAGRQIGRVPANLCRAFKILLMRNMVTKIICKPTGRAQPSVHPPSEQSFQRRTPPERYDREGGGAEIKCDYLIYINPVNFEVCMHVLEENVPYEELDARVCA